MASEASAPSLHLGDDVRVAAAAAMQAARRRLVAEVTPNVLACGSGEEGATLLAALEQALELAFRAADMILDATCRAEEGLHGHNLETKSAVVDFATDTDKAVEKMIFAGLAGAFPTHALIGEESASASPTGKVGALTDGYTWVVDPIDGTSNFVHGWPDVCVSIGLLYMKAPVLGVVHAPLHSQFYVGLAGVGAFRNGKRLAVPASRRVQAVSGALVAGGFSYDRSLSSYEAHSDTYRQLMVGDSSCHALRMIGSAVLALVRVAEGTLDAYICHGLHCWDMVAAWAVINEAGAVLASADGTAFDVMARHCIAGASPALVADLTRIVRHIEQKRDDI